MGAYYDENLKCVRGNKCFMCIPGRVFNKKEDELLKFAISEIDRNVEIELSSTSAKVFNFISFGRLNLATYENIPKGVQKAKSLIPGTIVKILNKGLFYFCGLAIPLTAIILCMWLNLFGIDIELWIKYVVTIGLYLFIFLSLPYFLSRQMNIIKEEYREEIRKVVSPI